MCLPNEQAVLAAMQLIAECLPGGYDIAREADVTADVLMHGLRQLENIYVPFTLNILSKIEALDAVDLLDGQRAYMPDSDSRRD